MVNGCGEDAARRAHKLWKQMLAEYRPPPVDAAVDEALRDVAARRETELA